MYVTRGEGVGGSVGVPDGTVEEGSRLEFTTLFSTDTDGIAVGLMLGALEQ